MTDEKRPDSNVTDDQVTESTPGNHDEIDPKFRAAEATPDPGRNVSGDQRGSVQEGEFVAGSQPPDAITTPRPTLPRDEYPETDPANAREPMTEAQTSPPGGPASVSDTGRSRQFSNVEPGADATTEHDNAPAQAAGDDQPLTDQLATAGSTTVGDDSPIEAVSTAASPRGSNLRQFPTLGGLENN